MSKLQGDWDYKYEKLCNKYHASIMLIYMKATEFLPQEMNPGLERTFM